MLLKIDNPSDNLLFQNCYFNDYYLGKMSSKGKTHKALIINFSSLALYEL